MRRTLSAVVLALTVLTVLVTPVWAYLWRAQVAIVENNTANWTMLGVSWNSSNTWMAANGFMRSDALDTRVQTLGGLNKPWMLTGNMTYTAIPVAQSSQTNLFFVTGETAASDMDIIPGYGGYVTTTDNTSLEPYGNFNLSISGYVDTTANAVSDNLVSKAGALRVWVPQTGYVAARSDNLTDREAMTTAPDINVSVFGASWYAQTFTPAPGYTAVRAEIYIQKVLAPTGNITVSIRNTAASLPTGPDLVSYAMNVADVGAAAAWVSFDFGIGSALANGTMYALVVGATGGDGANYIRWYAKAATDPYAGGRACSSADSGATWAFYGGAGNDFSFKVQSASQVTAAVASGVHTVAVSGDAVNLTLTVDGVVQDTDPIANVPNTANNWVWLLGDALPYASNITLTTGGVQRIHYNPNTIIQGNVLPNRATAGINVGQITWGANPTGVSVTLGSYVPGSQPAVSGTTSTPTANLLPSSGGSDWNVEPAVTGSLLTHPLRPLVTIVSDNTSLTERQTWIWGGIMAVVLVLVVVAKSVHGHQGITAVAAGAAIVAMVVQTIFPLYALVLAIPAIIGGILSERTQSL